MNVHKSTIPFSQKIGSKSSVRVSDLATLALVVRSTTGALSGLGRMKAPSIWAIAQDPVRGTHPKPRTQTTNGRKKLNEKTGMLSHAYVAYVFFWVKLCN